MQQDPNWIHKVGEIIDRIDDGQSKAEVRASVMTYLRTRPDLADVAEQKTEE